MNARQVYLLCAILTLASLGIFTYRHLVLGFPLQPNLQVDAWDLELSIRFLGAGGPVKVELLLPPKANAYSVIEEQFVARGYGVTANAEDEHRIATWSVRRADGEQFLHYRAVVRPSSQSEAAGASKPPRVSLPRFEGASRAAAEIVFADVHARSADAESFVKELLKALAGPIGKPQHMVLLLGGHPSDARKVEVAARILAMANIPARPVHGVRLQPLARDAPFVHWLEVHHDGAWREYDLQTGERRVPKEYLAWWRGPVPMMRVSGGSELATRLSVSLNKQSALLSAGAREQHAESTLLEFSPLVLPIASQAVYHVLLVVPVGVLILVMMRNLVGVKTFGTFMPVLIALAFRETRLLSGIMLFCLLVGAGLALRFYLERLKLLVVPRLAAVLIVVLHLMFLLDLLSYKFGLQPGLSVTLFPMVIMTMTIERMSVVWEERGAGEALQQSMGSLAVAVLAYLAMNLDFLQHLFFVFPELILIILAVTILLGRYTGYRLLELKRFNVLAAEEA